jgi:hypothetical protein
MAQQWQSFEADKDLYPNLRYVTAGDARVRDAHKVLDGLILPINHPFWKTHATPNDWGCRCFLEQSDETPWKKIPEFKIKKEFENNPALSGKIFNETIYENELTSKEAKQVKSKANKYLANVTLNKKRSEQFKEVYKKGKGSVLEHQLIQKGNDYNDILKTAKLFANKGKVTELLPEINQKEKSIRAVIFPSLKSKTANPDLKIGNNYYDVKRPKAIKNIVGNANKASKQGAIAVISDSELEKPLTDNIMLERAKDIFKNKTYKFNEVVFLRLDKLVVFNRKGV